MGIEKQPARSMARVKVAAFLSALLGVSIACALFTQEVVFDGVPHVNDAGAHLFQSRVFRQGDWFAPAPPCHQCFALPHLVITTDGKWFSKYPPGYAAMLAGAGLLHLERLLLPLLFAAGVYWLYRLARMFSDEGTARWCSVLFVASPIAGLLGGSFMSHTPFVSLYLGGFYAACRAWRERDATPPRRTWRALWAGFLLGGACVIRPHEAILVSALILAFSVGTLVTDLRYTIRLAVAAMLGAMPWLVLQLAYFSHTMGDAWMSGYALQSDRILTPLYHDRLGFGPGFLWQDGVRQTIWSLYRFNFALFGWPCSYALLPFALVQRDRKRQGLFCAALCLAVIALYGCYNYYGYEYEARYYYVLVPALCWMTAEGVRGLAVTMERRLGWSSRASRRMTISLLAAGFLFSGLYYWPATLWPRYAHDYEDTSGSVRSLAASMTESPSVVLLDRPEEGGWEYLSALPTLDPYLKKSPILTRDGDGCVECLAAAFPRHTIYRAKGKALHLTVAAVPGSPADEMGQEMQAAPK